MTILAVDSVPAARETARTPALADSHPPPQPMALSLRLVQRRERGKPSGSAASGRPSTPQPGLQPPSRRRPYEGTTIPASDLHPGVGRWWFNPSASASANRYLPCGPSSTRLRRWAAAVVLI